MKKIFIDGRGGAALSFEGGAEVLQGRDADGLCQPMTTCFRVANVDIDQIKWMEIQEAYLKWKEQGKISETTFRKIARENAEKLLGL